MADLPPDSDTYGRAPTTGTPRWMMMTGIAVIVLVIVVVIVLLTGGSLGGHGPGMHTP